MEIKIGIKLYTYDLKPKEVTKIGRKYFYVDGKPEGFDKTTLLHVGYNRIQLYEYEDVKHRKEVEKYFSKIKQVFNSSWSGMQSGIKLDNLKKIFDLLR